MKRSPEKPGRFTESDWTGINPVAAHTLDHAIAAMNAADRILNGAISLVFLTPWR
jgi:hypothetical protein